MPALWTVAEGAPVHAGTAWGDVSLVPVCAHPGKLHPVGVAEAARVSGSSSSTQAAAPARAVTPDEAHLLQLVHAGVQLCSGEAINTAGLGSGGAGVEGLAQQLVSRFSDLGPVLHPVWRPTSSAPLWVCEEHVSQFDGSQQQGVTAAQATAGREGGAHAARGDAEEPPAVAGAGGAANDAGAAPVTATAGTQEATVDTDDVAVAVIVGGSQRPPPPPASGCCVIL